MKTILTQIRFKASGWMACVILLVLATTSIQAQSDTVQNYSLQRLHERYFGYHVSVGSQNYKISSDIPQLDGMRVSREGCSIGVVYGNQRGMLRANVGLYYSSPSVPYSVDVLEAGFSKTFYLLHFRSSRSHTFEPYAVLSAKVLQSSFYGNYLETISAYNPGREKLAGRVISSQALAGIGVEYQLVNEKLNFIHLFAELRVGTTLTNGSRFEAFESTRAVKPAAFAFGINFGHIR